MASDNKTAQERQHQTEEELRRSNADLEQFAYSISHDMRQPLRMIRGHLQLLERSLQDKLDGDEQESLHYALDGAQRLDAMIVSLLDYSRVGRKTSPQRWIETRAALDEALHFLEPMIEESQAEIQISGQWPGIHASHDEIARLLQNLLANALKYHDPEQTVRVAAESKLTDTHWLVCVRDNGIGIAPEQIPRLFQFYSRLQTRSRFEGTGMGLALCRRIVEHYGGRIWAESEGDGKGSCFCFEIPLKTLNPPPS